VVDRALKEDVDVEVVEMVRYWLVTPLVPDGLDGFFSAARRR